MGNVNTGADMSEREQMADDGGNATSPLTAARLEGPPRGRFALGTAAKTAHGLAWGLLGEVLGGGSRNVHCRSC